MSLVNIRIDSEDNVQIVKMTRDDVVRVKVLLKSYMKTGNWSDDINTIIDRSEVVTCVGVINTTGDGGGWYKA